MSTSTPTLTELAKTISTATSTLEELLQKHNQPQPSFGTDGLAAYPHDPVVMQVKSQLYDAVNDLQQLLNPPHETYGAQILANIHDLTVLKVFNQYNFWDAVPLTGSATTKEIAAKVKLPEEIVTRLIRHGTTSRVFSASGDSVAHTARSGVFVKDVKLRAWVGHHLDESWTCGVNYPDALRTYNANTVEPNKTAASYTFWRNDPSIKTVFEFFNKPEQQWRVARFGTAMESATASPAFTLNHLHAMYDWKSLGSFKFVDIGGSVGHISFLLAAAYPQANFIVQDLPELEPSFKKILPAELKDRVSFQGHDFFTPQPVKDADIYFFKHILHDWSDPYAAKIIQQIIPVLTKPGAKLMLMEGVVPPKDQAPSEIYRTMTALDLQMLTMCNSKERTAEQWSQLLTLADPKLELVAIHAPPGSAFVLIEAQLQS